MTGKKNIILDTKNKALTFPLLVMVMFTLFFVLISQASERYHGQELKPVPTVAGMKTIYHEKNVEDINVILQDGWYFFPNMTTADYEAKRYNFLQLMDLPHAENVSISGEYGWNDLGNNSYWVNTDKAPSLSNDEKSFTVSAMYMIRIQLVPNTDTIYLQLDDINGTGAVYCNRDYVGSIGDDSLVKFDVTHSSECFPVTSNRAAIIDLCIIVNSDSRIQNPGISINPTITSINTENSILVGKAIWFSYQIIMLVSCIIGGLVLVRTFVIKRKFFIIVLIGTLHIVFTALDCNFITLPLIARSIICQTIVTAIIVLSYLFISSLFYDEELYTRHKLLKYDYIFMIVIAAIILLVEYINSSLMASVYPSVTTLALLSLAVSASIIKILFLHLKDKNSSMALIFLSTIMFTVIYMVNRKTTAYGVKIYSLFFVVLFFVILINYTRGYVQQFNELSNMSSRLQYLLKEKTQHISEINKDLYNTNKKLMENEEARKNVLSNVSHDLRTPITAIRGYAELLQSAGSTMKPEQVQNYLGNIIKRSTQMERIVSDIVELTRMESNTNEFQFMDVSMAELLDELYMMYEGDVRGTQKKLQIDLPETDLLMVKADPKKISRVFENLISNAINYTYDEALIKIHAWRDGEGMPVDQQTVHITIEDNGIGIPQEEIDKVFDRFYRAKNSGKNIKGTGLGLSIVKTIIDHHDASIAVTSKLGSGTSFHITMKATY